MSLQLPQLSITSLAKPYFGGAAFLGAVFMCMKLAKETKERKNCEGYNDELCPYFPVHEKYLATAPFYAIFGACAGFLHAVMAPITVTQWLFSKLFH